MRLVDGVEIHALVVILTSLDLISIDHNGGDSGDELDGLAYYVCYGGVVGVHVIGIKSQHRAGKLVHDVGRGRLYYHVLGKIFGQLSAFAEDFSESVKLFPCGQLAEKQQPGNLLKAEMARGGAALDNLGNVDSPIGKLALVGNTRPVGKIISVDVAYAGQTRHNARAVGIAKPSFDVIGLIIIGAYIVIFLILFT